MKARKIFRLLAGFALTVLFLWLIFRQIRVDDIHAAFDGTHLHWLILAILTFFLGYACRIERWRLMLLQDNPLLRWQHCAAPFMTSIAANNVLPFRAGDVLRAFGFTQKLGITVVTATAALLVERLLDLLMLILFFAGALLYFKLDTSHFLNIGWIFLLLGGIALCVVLLFPQIFQPIVLFFTTFFLKYLPTVGKKIDAISKNFFSALKKNAQTQMMTKLLFWSLLAWLGEGLVFWCAALAMPSLAQQIAAWLALPIGTLATIIPSTPGYVGTFDYFIIQAMTVSGNTLAAATAYAFLVHIILWLPPTIIGALSVLANAIAKTNKPSINT